MIALEDSEVSKELGQTWVPHHPLSAEGLGCTGVIHPSQENVTCPHLKNSKEEMKMLIQS